jgi:hypothetical protein
MPTRIVLRETEATSQRRRTQLSPDEEQAFGKAPVSKESPSSGRSPHAVRVSSRRIVGFRSSLIRDVPQEAINENERGLSTTDISASPRLVGYLFQLLASSVMLISVLKFYAFDDSIDLYSEVKFYNSVKGPIFRWKLIGCMAIASVGCAMCLFPVLMHFDTICFPQLWLTIFRDGSKYEQKLLLAMLLFWAVGLQICTSTLSVGEVQANVFFTSWIAFMSAALNYGVWRVSAGYQSIAEWVNLHHRETTYNWLWTMFFACACAGSISGVYRNREYVTIWIKGEELVLTQREWIRIVVLMWGLVGVCIIALLFNHYLDKSWEMKFFGGYRIILGWRQAEGFVALGMVVAFFWFVYDMSGVDGVISGMNNGYFGLWGTFINSIFTLGTWLRENKNIEYIVQDQNEAATKSTSRVRR